MRTVVLRGLAASVAIGAAVAVTGPTGAGAAPPAPPASPANRSSSDDVAAHWNAERRNAAIPRDLVIDGRGLAYLRGRDGALHPYGHATPARADDLRAEPAAGSPAPTARPAPGGGGSDTTGPVIDNRDPAQGATIGSSHTFKATVTDTSGVKSVTFVIGYPDGRSQSFAASHTGSNVWAISLSGFTNGSWNWSVIAKDRAKGGGNTTQSPSTGFTVNTTTTPPPPTGDVVTNSEWTSGGSVQTTAGRIYFEMPANPNRTRWVGYVCSGTTIADGTTARSIILSAAHCIYDDQYKSFARNVMFIPDQDATTATGTDRNCDNDEYGCWIASHGVVDNDWASRTFPANIEWDYGFYVVSDTGAHQGNGSHSALDGLGTQSLNLSSAPAMETVTAALGYSYSEDPNFMYCQEGLDEEGTVNWWLPSCGLSGGSSGGPWLQPVNNGDGPIVSVNSWGYTNQPGMAGPKLAGSSAGCLLTAAKSTTLGTVGGSIPSGC